MGVPSERGRKVRQEQASPLRPFYIIIGVVALVGVGGLTAFALMSTGTGPTPVLDPASGPVTSTAATGKTADGFYFRGETDAPVTVVEYADFQCPACAAFVQSSVYQQLKGSYVESGQVQYIFHDFPLPQHRNSPVAAESAYCAGEQGDYWTMHERIFQTQQQWTRLSPSGARDFFGALAEQSGLDRAALESCLSAGTFTSHVQGAYDSSVQAGINATPSFVVNGRTVNATQLLPAIDAALAPTGSGQ